MIWRAAAGPLGLGTAAFSDDLRHRCLLTRHWGAGPVLLFVGLNPSRADEAAGDPTLARLLARARGGGFGGLAVANLCTLISADPRALREVPDPVASGADALLAGAARAAAAVLCGWGDGAPQGRVAAVAEVLLRAGRPLLTLGRTVRGAPRHPLYLPRARAAEPLAPAELARLAARG